MADSVAKARSEARRKRILENADKRINRLYSRQRGEDENSEENVEGRSEETAESPQWQCDKCGNINFGNRKMCLLCRGKHLTDEEETPEKTESQVEVIEIQKKTDETDEKSDEENSKEMPKSSPHQNELRQRRTQNTVKLQRGDVPQESSSVPPPQCTVQQPVQKSTYSQSQLFEIYRILGCMLIAFVSRMVLKSGYGLFYFESVFLPFTAFQTGLHLFKNNFLKDVHIYQRHNMMSTALMLCGISPNLIGTYNKIMGYVKSVTEDLFFFIFVFFAVGFCI
ncbi:guided entry of tail-anchored proteins factor CAMLG-like [Ostrea edulis]|uniref:guided entry of tail-anchored proteins factor CAMLG-like n=1 Tax=Ostrea edulis TaxID=37623 RepID=UPI0020963A72|nr:guided entry of tail-anchored proteins factor CAMLG-like [Ostrea edulis]XP_056018951.1 guided entry of tail-anchored proteins factor CAMLG-like [Ostrea edulis]